MTPLQVLLEAARLSREADFSIQRESFQKNGSDEPVLDAGMLRLLILGIRPSGFPDDFDPAKTIRWSIRGATIDAILDLLDGRSYNGDSLPSLTFTDCLFRQRLCAENAHLGSLTLRNCRFALPDNDFACQLGFRNLRCDGELLLDGVHALHEGDFFALDARTLRVGCSLIIRNSVFQARHNHAVPDILDPIYAINLRSADIRGDLFLEPKVKAYGGIHATGAQIGGSLYAAGLQASDGYDDDVRIDLSKKQVTRGALILDNSTVGGNLFLGTLFSNEPFQTTGAVSLETIQIYGNLSIEGAEMNGTGVDQRILIVLAGRVRGYVSFRNAETPNASLENRIGGTIDLSGLEVGADLFLCCHFSSLFAPNLRVEGNTNIVDLRASVSNDADAPNVNTLIQIQGASIKGSLSLINKIERASLTATDIASRNNVLTLYFNGLTVQHGVYLSGTYSNLWATNLSVSNDLVLNIELLSKLVLVDAKIGGNLDLSRFHFTNRGNLSALGIPGLWLTNAEIRGSLRLGVSSGDDNNIVLRRARISSPPCYPSLRVIEVEAFRNEAAKKNGQTAWSAFLAANNGIASPLDGNSYIFHLANAAGLRRSRTDPEIADYFRLFCAYVWGDDGSFKILEDTRSVHGRLTQGEMPPIVPIALSKPTGNSDKGVIARLTTTVLYGNKLFHADFMLPENGIIEMRDDTNVAKLDSAEQNIYETPLRRGPHAEEPDYQPPVWEDLSEEELAARVPRWKESFRQTVSFANAFIDLQNASCTTLEDSDGTAWGNLVQLRLENFSFRQVVATQVAHETAVSLLWTGGEKLTRFVWNWHQRVSLALQPHENTLRRIAHLPPRAAPELKQALSGGAPLWFSNLASSRPRRTGVLDRLGWLEQRFVVGNIPTRHPGLPVIVRDSFLPQPYAQLAKVFRDQGAETAAKKVEEQRIRTEHWIRAKESFTGKLFLPISGLFRIGFRYGLSPGRAAVTFVSFLLLGWGAVHFTNTGFHPLLTQNTQTANTVATESPDGITAAIPIASQERLLSELPCGRNISEFLYAVDVFIPLLDLRQEERCDIRPLEADDQRPFAAFHLAPGTSRAKLSAWLHATAIYPPLWQWLKASYAVLGWIITSLAILTFSGTLRKWDES